MATTPLRRCGERDEDGLRVVSTPDVAYRDGAEAELLQVVQGADDLSSWSSELHAAAHDWPTTYSLSHERAHLLRALDLPAHARVLEIGAGCGPLTRYMGERCALVDALEPVRERALVAASRTRDLPSVEVVVGRLEDVPAEPVYDVVVVVGVLEYVGEGSADADPYVAFLERCRGVLRPGGTLVLAIENALGVKYVAGSAEDHTNRPFDSLEGYALPSPARTFSRRGLARLLDAAGLTSQQFLGVFPDYKLPRSVLTDTLFERSEQLAATLPRFPSTDHVVPRLQLADEARTWRTLVEAGVGPHFVNSFLVLASERPPRRGALHRRGRPLWDGDRLATVLSTGRALRYATRLDVVDEQGGLVARRAPLLAAPAGDGEGADGLHVRHAPPPREAVVAGEELMARLLHAPERRGELVRGWLGLLPEPDAEEVPVDLVPHNVVVDAAGELHAIDQEWWVRGYDVRSVVVRGLVHAAVHLAGATRPETLAPWATVADAATGLAEAAGESLTPADLDRFVALEAQFQATVNTSGATFAERRERAERDLRALWSTTLAAVRGGERFDVQWAAATAQLAEHAVLLGDRAELVAENERLTAEVARLRPAPGVADDAAASDGTASRTTPPDEDGAREV